MRNFDEINSYGQFTLHKKFSGFFSSKFKDEFKPFHFSGIILELWSHVPKIIQKNGEWRRACNNVKYTVGNLVHRG